MPRNTTSTSAELTPAQLQDLAAAGRQHTAALAAARAAYTRAVRGPKAQRDKAMAQADAAFQAAVARITLRGAGDDA